MEFESDLPQKILDLLASAGYSRAHDSSFSVFDKVTGGLLWCVASCNDSAGQCVASDDGVTLQDKLRVGEIIEAELRSLGCPYPLESRQIQRLDYDHVYPVLQWILNRITSIQQNAREEKHADTHAQLNEAREKINATGHGFDFNGLEHLLSAVVAKRDKAQDELTSRLRELVHLKHQFDDVPIQMELIQYERRFAELYMQIQEKLQHTRRLYDTFNALLETKELASKEISLLNSIHQQFQDAITSSSGRTKLIDSLESIAKGTQQKLEKLWLTLEEEQKICSGFEEKLTRRTEEQHHFSFLLKSFQDEYVKNERLQTARAPT